MQRGLICAVRLTTTEGAAGLGQTAPCEAGLTARILRELVAPAFLGRDVDAEPGPTERVIRVMRERLPEMSLRADANGDFTVSRAIPVGRMLGEHDYSHFEEPCPFPEIEQTGEVARALDIAVGGGEQDTSSAQFQRMVTGRAVDTLQPDVGYLGGISRTRKIAVLAEAAGRRTRRRTSGSRCSIPGPDGRVAAPTAPGRGVELLPELMASADRRESGIGDAGR